MTVSRISFVWSKFNEGIHFWEKLLLNEAKVRLTSVSAKRSKGMLVIGANPV